MDNASDASLKTYAYDDAFRITGIAEAADSTLSWTFGYDVLDRLNAAIKTGASQGWTYDANGNRLTETGSTPSTYTNSGTSNRVSSISGSLARTYAYDNAGNTLSYAGATFTYNNRGRMITATNGGVTATYAYNALGQRIKRTASGVTTLYVYDEAGHLAGEYTAAGALIQETVWLGNLPVATLRPNGLGGVNVYYVHADHLNSPRLVTDTSNNIRWSWESDPFGTTMPNENPSSLGVFVFNLRFPGQQYDAVVGLHYNYFRDYDPAVGRYVESDPIGLSGGSNTYGHVSQNPVSIIDPLGLLVWNNVTTYASDRTPGARWPPIPGLPAAAGNPNAGGNTIVDWTIKSRCACNSSGARFEEFTVEFRTNVHLRPGMSNELIATVKNAEQDHIRDYLTWANSKGKQIAEERETRYKLHQFASMAECEDATTSSLDGALRRGGILDALLDTLKKYDYPGGPHHH